MTRAVGAGGRNRSRKRLLSYIPWPPSWRGYTAFQIGNRHVNVHIWTFFPRDRCYPRRHA